MTDTVPRKAEAMFLQGEVGKDLVKLPVDQIEKRVLLSGPSVRPRRGPQ